jgi:type IV pilus assembly protein PilV
MKRPIDSSLPRARRQAGFSLLEVLVAVVVLAIGLLGLAALQLKGLQSAHSGYQRTVASMVANDAAERLWVAVAAATPVATVQTEWRAAWQPTNAEPNRATLPGIAASTIDDEGDGTFLITVQWIEGRFADDDADASTFEYRIALPNP